MRICKLEMSEFPKSDEDNKKEWFVYLTKKEDAADKEVIDSDESSDWNENEE